jgi:cytochrome c oxidase assembly factor CtaG
MLLPACVAAHEVASDSVGSGSSSETLLFSVLFGTAAWYAGGAARVFKSAGGSREMLRRRFALFIAAWATLAASLLTPLHEMGGRSFTAHMVEHELLMLVAAPLIAFSQPLAIFLWALPKSWRQACARLGHDAIFSRVWQSASGLLGASLIQAIMLWSWHVPGLFNRALRSEGWHIAQHLSFVLAAILFWWSVHRAARLRHNGAAAAFLFLTSLHTSLLGVLMSFSGSPWYAQYAELGMSGTFGLTALEDQQLAGLIMWIPGGAVHAIAALIYFSRSLVPTANMRDREWHPAS